MNKLCLRRLVLGSRRLVGNMKTNIRYVCHDYNSTLIQTTNHPFQIGSHDAHPAGAAYELAIKPIRLRSQLVESGGCVVESGGCDVDMNIDALASEEMHIIEQGHVVNLSQLLFTKNRDYLVRYNDPQRATADQLSNKVVLLYFLDRNPYTIYADTTITSLIDVYNDLKHKNCFEVIFVYVADVLAELCGNEVPGNSSSQTFEDIFSRMPWTAIPFSDVISRKYLTKRFGLHKDRLRSGSCTFVVDPTGLVLPICADSEIGLYGSLAFPFTEEKIVALESELYATFKQPSLKSLLVTPERDYVISNKDEKIPIQTLEDKVVALLFFEDGMDKYYPIRELKRAYEELRKNNKNFEVVLVYLTDTLATYLHTNKDTYWKTFKTMPWLALPFKDPIHKKLERLFYYPEDNGSGVVYVPRIVILGPHMDYIEPCAAEILSNFGVSSYPFTRENLVRLDAEKVKELKLEILCSPTTVFKRKDGFQVQFSQLLGKRVILYFENRKYLMRECVIGSLKERYLRMKGTDDEFEVIYVPCANDDYPLNELLGDVSWFVSPDHSVFLPGSSAAFTLFGKFYKDEGRALLLAFGQDGQLVRKSFYPMVNHEEFPFYDGSMEGEAFEYLTGSLIDFNYRGLLKNSFEEDNYYDEKLEDRV